MAFTLETWQEKAKAKLQEAAVWLGERRRRDVPYVVYGTVAGLSLWPLVEAAVRTGELATVVGAVYTVTAGIGANLIASQIERWKDQAEPPDEHAVVDGVAQQAAEDDELRDGLDAILERLDAVSQLQAALMPDDQKWAQSRLASELARLGNLSRYQAKLKGSGAIAQGAGATAVGERGVHVGGNVGGSIVTGDHNVVDSGPAQPQLGAAGGGEDALAGSLAGLRERIAFLFNDEELRDLCHDMEINYEFLAAENLSGKARELVLYCQRHNRLDDLLGHCRRLRPETIWSPER